MTISRYGAVTLACLWLAACGGGGGGGDGVGAGGSGGGGGGSTPTGSISYSVDELNFNTAAPWVQVPTPQTQPIIGTVSGVTNGTLYIVVRVNNPELVSVGNVFVTSQTTGSATVTPVNPQTLAIGEHRGTIVISACLNDSQCNSGHLTGSPKTIPITYTIGSNVEGDSVSPNVVAANTAGSMILRGSQFPAGAAVSIGGVPAVAVNVVSNSEIRVDYPQLGAGKRQIAINNGAVPFTGAVTVVGPNAFQQEFLSHPNTEDTFVYSMEYDAERHALLVAGSTYGSTSRPVLARFEFVDGHWLPPVTVENNVRQLRMSHDGSTVLALRAPPGSPYESYMDELDPVTLATQVSTRLMPAEPFFVYATSFALANDGNAIVNTRVPGSGIVPQYLFGTRSRSYRALPMMFDSFGTVTSADGSLAVFLSSSGSVFYDPSTGRLRQQGTVGAAFEGGRPSASLTGSLFQTGAAVYNRNQQLLGYATAPRELYGAAINRAGTRLYAYTPYNGLPNSSQLYVFDLTVPAQDVDNVLRLQQMGQPIDLALDPGGTRPTQPMIVTPQDDAVIIAGSHGIAVVPVQ